MKYMNR